MGYDRVSAQVFGRVSRHNSPRDDEHDALWADLMERVRAVVADEKYEPIDVEFWY